MTKQETIKKHYITEFINSGMSQQEAEQKWEHIEEFINPDDGYFQNREEYYRPISLRGIETNNGWTAILSEKDLPSEDIDVHIVFEVNEKKFQTFGVWDKRLNSFWSGAMKIENPTHYQPITKPLPPLH